MSDSFVSRFEANVAERSRRRKYLVGVSGGGDSVALLHLLRTHGFRKLIVCHLDHRLRGSASTRDAAFVKRLCAKWDLTCYIGREDVAARSEAERLSLETAGRQARHEFFAKIARTERSRTFFLGHHADDQAETILANLLRGGGLAGLSGMRPDTELKVGRTPLRLLRPLQPFTREEIAEYLARHRLSFRSDESNDDPRHGRNKLRHQLLPGLSASLGRDVRKSLLRLAEVASAENDLLESLLPTVPEVIALREFRALHLALQRRFLKNWLAHHAVRDVSFDLVERVRGLAHDSSTAVVNLPGDRRARRRAGRIFLDDAGRSPKRGESAISR